MDNTITETRSGPVSGTIEKGIYRYLGIPYAAPPVASRRWKPPIPPNPWRTVRRMDTFGAACCQSMLALDPAIEKVSEDCLYLNIWTPSIDTHASLPVMVYLHGGGFARGSGGSPIYNQPYLAEKGIVLVTVNYRLGALGFLAHSLLNAESPTCSSGNYGLMDQIAALQWIKHNICNFGGNPQNITVFGQSAGGASVIALMSSPLTKGLFHRAIAQSCGYAPQIIRHRNTDQPGLVSMESLGLRLCNKLGLTQGTDILHQLRARPWQELVKGWETSVQNFADGSGIPGAWMMNHISVDGYVLLHPPGKVFRSGQQLNIPFMTGITADEGTLLAQLFHLSSRDKYHNYISRRFGRQSIKVLERYPVSDDTAIPKMLGALLGDSFNSAASMLCDTMCVIQPQTYMYKFNVQPKILVLRMPGIDQYRGQFGCYHSAELPYLFHYLSDSVFSEADRHFKNEIMEYWTRFARSGNPNGGNSVRWPDYNSTTRLYLNIDTPITYKQEELCEASAFIKELDTPGTTI